MTDDEAAMAKKIMDDTGVDIITAQAQAERILKNDSCRKDKRDNFQTPS